MLDEYNNTNIIVWFSRQAGKTQNISDDIWFRAWNHMTSESSHASKIYDDSQQNEYTSNNVTISKSCFVAKTVFSSGETWEQKLPDHDLLSHSTIGIFKQILIIRTKTSNKTVLRLKMEDLYVFLIWPLIAASPHQYPVDIAAPQMLEN